jgi:hypothetical protein
MRPLLVTVVGVLALLAGGCAGQISEMPTWVGFDEDGNVEAGNDAGIIVLKVAPPAQVLLAAGRIEPNGWRSKGAKNRVWLSARDGFVVARVAPARDEDAYAVIQVRPGQLAGGKDGTAPTYETGFWSALPASAAAEAGGDGPAYGPAGEARVPLFKAIAGRVAFVGAIRIEASQEPDSTEAPRQVGVTPVASPDDLEAVRRFLAQRYPKVTARVVSRPLQMMRRSESTE